MPSIPNFTPPIIASMMEYNNGLNSSLGISSGNYNSFVPSPITPSYSSPLLNMKYNIPPFLHTSSPYLKNSHNMWPNDFVINQLFYLKHDIITTTNFKLKPKSNQ